MPVTVANLGVSSGTSAANPDLRDITDLATYANTAWTPNANRLVLVFQMARLTAGAIDPTMDGNGLTWTKIVSTTFDAGTRNLALFAALTGGAPTNTVNQWIFGVTMLNCYSMFCEVDGYDTGLSITDLVKAEATSGAAATSGSITHSGTGIAADDRAVSCFSHDANEAATEDADWTGLDDVNGAGPASGHMTQYRTNAQDLSSSASWTTSSDWGAIHAFVKAPSAAAASLVPHDVGPPPHVLRMERFRGIFVPERWRERILVPEPVLLAA